MPNTLAHLGVQGVLVGTVARRELAWALIGAALPDLPWIVHRVAKRTAFWLGLIEPGAVAASLYSLRLYAIVQATLLFCLVLAGAAALVARRPARVFGILAASALLHLLLDASQTKWGNGVHLLAPLSWRETGWHWYWPESPLTWLLTAAGLLVVAMVWRQAMIAPPSPVVALGLPRARLGASLALLAAWALAPLALMPSAEAADAHYIRTLRERDRRIGRPIELHRAFYRETEDGPVVRTMIEEELRVDRTRGGAELEHELPAWSRISVRGRFVAADRIELEAWHRHRAGLRDAASYVGLALVAAFWLSAAWRGARGSRAVSGAHRGADGSRRRRDGAADRGSTGRSR